MITGSWDGSTPRSTSSLPSRGCTGPAQAGAGEQQFFFGMALIKGRQVLRSSVPVYIHRLGKDRPGIPEKSLVDRRS